MRNSLFLSNFECRMLRKYSKKNILKFQLKDYIKCEPHKNFFFFEGVEEFLLKCIFMLNFNYNPLLRSNKKNNWKWKKIKMVPLRFIRFFRFGLVFDYQNRNRIELVRFGSVFNVRFRFFSIWLFSATVWFLSFRFSVSRTHP